MAVNLSPIWGAGAQLLDNSGNVLSGGKIYTYAAGTTTQVATYTSNTGVTANSNPIVLNSAGRVPYEIWLTDGQNYKFVLKDSNDTLIGTWDNLSGINSNFIAYTNQQEIQTATAGQTVFNLTTMNYLPGTNSLSVFVDGVNQYGPGAQYAYEETDSNTITFASGLHVGAEVKFTSSQIQNAGVADASQIGYTYPATNAVTQNVENRLKQQIYVNDFIPEGTDPSITVCDTYFENAIAAAAGKTLVATGTYLINGPLSLESDSVYQFTGATFIAGPLQDLAFRTISKDNIWVYGGSYTGVAGTTPVETSHPTGDYWRGGPFWFEGCNNVNIYYTQVYHFFGAMSFYNCSTVSACFNFLSDNAGGIQAVSDTAYAGDENMQGLDFSSNTILHSGDDALTFLVRNTGLIVNSLITNNYVTKDPGINGTVGVSKAVAIYGDFGATGTYRIYNINVSNNIGYYMGESFIRVQNAYDSVFKGNCVDVYGAAGGDNAYTFGYDSNTGIESCIIDGNIAANPANAYPAMHVAYATRCRILNNRLRADIAGTAPLVMLTCTHCFVSGNVLINSLAYGLQLDSGCVSNQIQNNDVLITAVLPISNGGTNTSFYENNGYVSQNYGNGLVPAGATSHTVLHGLTTTSTTSVRVTITPTSSTNNASKYWISSYVNGGFVVTTNVAPGTGDFTFSFVAEEIPNA